MLRLTHSQQLSLQQGFDFAEHGEAIDFRVNKRRKQKELRAISPSSF